MPTEETNDSAQGGAQPTQTQTPAPQGAGGGAPAPAQPSFSAEQQAHVDRLVGERLKRAQEKWAADQEAKVKADAEAAEAERQKKQGEWEALARKHEGKAADLEGKFKAAEAQLTRANAVIEALVEGRKKGLPEAMLKALEGRDLYDQLQLADAYWQSQPAAAGQRTAATSPTPAAQPAGQGDFVRQAIERQHKRATDDDPFAAMMKR